MGNTLKDSLEDAILYALDAEQGAPHSGVDMTVVVDEFIKYLAHRGYAVVDGARAILVPTSEMCAACEALDESDDCSCVCHLPGSKTMDTSEFVSNQNRAAAELQRDRRPRPGGYYRDAIDAQTDDASDPYPRGLTEWDRYRYREGLRHPRAKVETIFDVLSRLAETLSTREEEASTIAASAAELSGTPAPYWRGLAEGYRRCYLAVSQIITDAQTGGLHPAELCGEDCSGCCDE